jgi:4-carboxymuconolactone decarboxylase
VAVTDAAATEAFRRLALSDPEVFSWCSPAGKAADRSPALLDPRTEALLRIAALVAIDAPAASYRTVVTQAMLAGARLADLLGMLLAIASEVGSPRVVAAAPLIALAAGYDVEAGLE